MFNIGRFFDFDKLKIFSKGLQVVGVFVLCFWLLTSTVWATDSPTIGELHPPVVISVDEQAILVFFLKNNLKNTTKDMYVADAEIFYSPMNFDKPALTYVWKIEGEQILSIFFYKWKSVEKMGRSMYVLTRSPLSNGNFEGVTYSSMELSVIKNEKGLSLSFFSGETTDSTLQNCNEGRNLVTGKMEVCLYKDASSIKRYLSAQDGQSSLT